MKVDKKYIIPFIGLKLGLHDFDFQLDKEFFESFDYDEFNEVGLKVELQFEKKEIFFELNFKMSGFVEVPCDVSNELFKLKVEGDLRLIVQFSDEFNDDDIEILYLPHGEYQVDVSQYIYDLSVLSVPIKRVHPGIADGRLKLDVIDKLEENNSKSNIEIDPRWDKLKALITENK